MNDAAGPARSAGSDNPLLRRLAGFARFARRNGFPVGLAEVQDSLALARDLDLSRPQELRTALRVLLCSCAADWRKFDELFDAYWWRRGIKRAQPSSGAGRSAGPPTGAAVGEPLGHQAGETEGAAAEGGGRPHGASAAENLASTDLRHIHDPDELARIEALAQRLAARLRQRLTRRTRRRPDGYRLDMRGTIHRSLAYGGMPMRLAFRKRWPRPVRLVLILDGSGSMSLYSAFFLRFMRAVLDAFHDADAFAFHTRLVHLGPALREPDIGRAIEKLTVLAAGWLGGTKIGESLRTFNHVYSRGVLNRRTVVMILSDGYDTGPPALLAEQLQTIKRRARRLIWLNPVMGWPGYEPTATGMAAALPHLDLLAPAHNLASLAALEPYLARL